MQKAPSKYTPESESYKPPPKKVDPKDQIEILSTNANWRGKGHKYIRVTGELQNNTGKRIKAIELEGVLYDENKLILDTQTMYENEVSNGERRAFSIPLLYSPRYDSYVVRIKRLY